MDSAELPFPPTPVGGTSPNEVIRSAFTNALGSASVDITPVSSLRDAAIWVLLGHNPRTITEASTRQRLLNAQMGLLEAFVAAEEILAASDESLLDCLREILLPGNQETPAKRPFSHLSSNERNAIWRSIGLPLKTAKNLTNRPDDDPREIMSGYIQLLGDAQALALEDAAALGHTANASLRIGDVNIRDPLTFLLSYGTAVGALTLTIRGSDKSRNGKQYERATLLAALTLAGLTLVEPNTPGEGVFWLSYQEDSADREADATVLLAGGKALKIDIGFIGEGNPEIVKDKLSRYARDREIAGAPRDVTTIVIADKISDGSGAWLQADQLEAVLIQMSDPNWLSKFLSILCENGAMALCDPALLPGLSLPEKRAAIEGKLPESVFDVLVAKGKSRRSSQSMLCRVRAPL